VSIKKAALWIALALSLPLISLFSQAQGRTVASFNRGWLFYLGNNTPDIAPPLSALDGKDKDWRSVDLPHDWSIELPFDKNSLAGNGGGALNGGMGWYQKVFKLPANAKNGRVFIDFDGVYRNSEVSVNGHLLGKRPNGYISFRYDITPYCKFGSGENDILVKVDNTDQPNSRWYSGSGIFRNVWLTTVNNLYVDYNGTYISTPKISGQSASVNVKTSVRSFFVSKQFFTLNTVIYTAAGQKCASVTSNDNVDPNAAALVNQDLVINNPQLWSVDNPVLYKAITQVVLNGKVVDTYTTTFGIRYFSFDINTGFSLNGKRMKINGVCDHHDLGCLGSAINTRALERQLEILKAMGCNGIRTSHNPPAPELLELADKMGFIVMDEAFDMWKKEKTKYDYHLYWDEWHKKDLEDQVIRDRNHPSVMIWSIGNEVMEQWDHKDSASYQIPRELSAIIRSLDTTRPITSATNGPYPDNPVIASGALDLVGYNYDQRDFATFPSRFPGKKFIGTETVSGLATRGHYDMPSDSIRRWPTRGKTANLPFGNPDTTCSAYDNCSAAWGSTQEETWKLIKKYDFLSGQYIWTGWDYIGEPTPYPWPARSSYFGIIDLAGFPKDVYYMYQSEWTNKTVLHIFPHWNWKKGDTVDVWAYYNNADQVELFLNNKSFGIKKKTGDDLHVMWRLPFEPGTLKAISSLNGKTVLTKEIKTAGAPARIELSADRNKIKADGDDLSFVTVKIQDAAGNVVPTANNLVRFFIRGQGTIAGTDNGCETDLASFQTKDRKAFNGLCLAVLRNSGAKGNIQLTATSEGLKPATVTVTVE
jgi:beta-galactosidase